MILSLVSPKQGSDWLANVRFFLVWYLTSCAFSFCAFSPKPLRIFGALDATNVWLMLNYVAVVLLRNGSFILLYGSCCMVLPLAGWRRSILCWCLDVPLVFLKILKGDICLVFFPCWFSYLMHTSWFQEFRYLSQFCRWFGLDVS